MEELKPIQHSLAYSSDKLLNLQILLMEIASRSSEMESLSEDSPNSFPDEPTQQSILEFDVLSGYLKSEVKQLDLFVVSVRQEIVDLHERLEIEERDCEETKEKLVSFADSLKNLRGLLYDVDKQSAKFEESLDLVMDKSRSSEQSTPHSGHLLLDGKTMNAKKQREVLHMLEKSLARETDLETRLTEALSSEEELRLKLHGLERESFFLQDSIESLYERTFQAENLSDLLLGISKGLIGKINSVEQGNLLRVRSLERQLSESKSEIESLEGKISEMKIKLESEVARSVELNEVNLKLKNEIERGNMLEKKVKDSETQFEHAKASFEAVLEQQSMLKSTMSDMENLIRDLKGKVVKEVTRAELAESRLSASNETNMELTEELGFLRGKVEMLEGSLTEVNSEKISTAKTIGVKSKAIASLVTKLVYERERLQIHVAKLTEKNKAMARRLKMNEGLNKEASTDSSTHIHVKDRTIETVSMNDANNEESVRDIGPRFMSWKYILFPAVFVVLVAVCLYFVNQNGNSEGLA